MGKLTGERELSVDDAVLRARRTPADAAGRTRGRGHAAIGPIELGQPKSAAGVKSRCPTRSSGRAATQWSSIGTDGVREDGARDLAVGELARCFAASETIALPANTTPRYPRPGINCRSPPARGEPPAAANQHNEDSGAPQKQIIKTTAPGDLPGAGDGRTGGIARGAAHFPIVGIGASAGGLEAFEAFFGKVPADCGMAFVLVPHLDPDHASILADILQRAAAIPVAEAEDEVIVRPGHVYIIPPNRDMSIARGA